MSAFHGVAWRGMAGQGGARLKKGFHDASSTGEVSMSETPSLPFDICENRHGGNEESREANRRIHRNKAAVRDAVMLYAERQGWHGITADEIAEAWECTANHVAPRISELRALGKLIRTDRRRKTRAGCSARVLIAAPANYAPTA